jgi:hypothetical protein
MLIKIIILLLLLLGFICLGLSLFYLTTDRGQANRTMNLLTWSLTLSAIAFAALLIAFSLGWLTPHGLIAQNP